MRVGLRRRSAMVAVGLLALGGPLAACTSAPEPPKPETTAAALAGGLTSGELGSVAFDGATPTSAATPAWSTEFCGAPKMPEANCPSSDWMSEDDEAASAAPTAAA